MPETNPERLIRVNTREDIESYRDVAKFLSSKNNSTTNLHHIYRQLDTSPVMGGLVAGVDKEDYISLTDNTRTVFHKRSTANNNGVVGVQAGLSRRYETGCILIVNVEPFQSDFLDRGLAWIALSRDVSFVPEFHTAVLGSYEIGTSEVAINEVAERLQNVEDSATAMIEDMLNNVQVPRFSRDSPFVRV